jgi:hypothetical protein
LAVIAAAIVAVLAAMVRKKVVAQKKILAVNN